MSKSKLFSDLHVEHNQVKYNKYSTDLKRFVSSTSLVPVSVHGYVLPEDKQEGQMGSISREGRGKYSIRIWRGHKDSLHPFETVLTTLAHELAHMAHWEHGRNHWVTMSWILASWGDILKDNKIDYSKGKIYD